MKIRSVDFVLFHVSDLALTVRFYRDVLGLAPTICSEADHWAEFDCGNVTLALKGGEVLVESGTGARVVLGVADIDLAATELVAQRVRLLKPLTDYGVCRAIEFLDPDGNVLVLHQRADGTCGQQQPEPTAV